MIEPQSRWLDQHRDGIDRNIVHLVFELARHLATAMDRRMAPFNVTGQQAALLLRCSVAPDATPSQLAPWLGTDNAGITRLLDRLEAKGLIERRVNPADRRAIVVQPTPTGRALVPDLVPAFREVIAQLLAGFSADELPVLESLLRRLLANIEMHDLGACHG
jgi:DNA-binding MarR family transcriptional regulator